MSLTQIPGLGAILSNDNVCNFRVWAPLHKVMLLELPDRGVQLEMQQDIDGYFSLSVPGINAGDRYAYRPGKSARSFPDPASFYQPHSVHDASAVVDHDRFPWTDYQWRGIAMEHLVIYELHVGTFTPQGTFDSVIPRLDELASIGINALELMPVAQFPGGRNWGYDAVLPYAVQNSYGGPDGLKRLVDACHAKGIAVILDVVYNHIGPEGNYFAEFGPYFTNKYCTPWGDALNFDGDWSDGVREYFCMNALYWFEYYHIDGLRLDAVHMVFDSGAIPFWQYVNDSVNKLSQRVGRPLHMIAESDLNSPRTISSTDNFGLGFSGQWLDDFHHALYVVLDENGKPRYEDFGAIEQLAKAYKDGFVHSGEYVKFRKRRHGASSAGVPGSKFIAFNLNHDQVGNRPGGERLCMLVDHERLKVGAAALLLSPYIPMLFMGEEYADESPFFYFVSHSDPALIEAVRKGRKEEFKNFNTQGEMPDPQSEETFRKSVIAWHKKETGKHRVILEWHRKLIELRKTLPELQSFDKNDTDVNVLSTRGLRLQRQTPGGRSYLLAYFNFSDERLVAKLPAYHNTWHEILNSSDSHWSEFTERSNATASRTYQDGVDLPPWSVIVVSSNQFVTGV